MTSTESETRAPLPSTASRMLGHLWSVIGLVLSGCYLANIGAGVFGEIPDILPGVGNLDEFIASAIFFTCLGRLGINVLPIKTPARTLKD